MNTCEFHWHAELEAENAKLRALLEKVGLERSGFQGELMAANLQVREQTERADLNFKNCREWEEHWKNAHAETIKVEAERDAALLQIEELKNKLETFEHRGQHMTCGPCEQLRAQEKRVYVTQLDDRGAVVEKLKHDCGLLGTCPSCASIDE